MSSLLAVEDLRVNIQTSRGTARVLDGVSLRVDKGERVGLVGESGSGKTMTALSIMRILPQGIGRIIGGRILFDGEDLLGLSGAAMRRTRGNRIAMVFQEPMTALNPVFKVEEQIAEPIRLHKGASRKAARKKTLELLEAVRVSDPGKVARSYPHQLSGGMRQRVMIAMAVSCEPELLILDEPTTALDVTVQAQILWLVNELKQNLGISLLFITHNLAVIAAICDRLYVMYAGAVVEEGSVDELFRNPLHPYTRGLLESTPRIDRKNDRLSGIGGSPPDPLSPPGGCSFHPRCSISASLCEAEKPAFTGYGKARKVACHFAGRFGGLVGSGDQGDTIAKDL